MKKTAYYLGNALMAFSFFIIIYIYYPVFLIYFFPQPLPKNLNEYSFSIEIPKLNIYSPVIANVDPFKSIEYLKALKKGVAQAKNFANPGQGKTVYLFAHSSGLPWDMTRYNTIFYRLPELKSGDLIIIRRNKKEYDYKVFAEKTVWPNQIQYLKKDSGNVLILQTCTPVGTDWQRLLVFAKPL